MIRAAPPVPVDRYPLAATDVLERWDAEWAEVRKRLRPTERAQD